MKQRYRSMQFIRPELLKITILKNKVVENLTHPVFDPPDQLFYRHGWKTNAKVCDPKGSTHPLTIYSQLHFPILDYPMKKEVPLFTTTARNTVGSLRIDSAISCWRIILLTNCHVGTLKPLHIPYEPILVQNEVQIRIVILRNMPHAERRSVIFIPTGHDI